MLTDETYRGRYPLKKFRILCIRCDHIGDLLVSTPVFHRLRKLYPDAEIHVVTSPAGRLALADNPDIDGIFLYNKKSISSWFRLLPELWRHHDMVIGLNAGSRTIRLLASLSRGVKKGFLQTGNLAPWSGAPEAVGHISVNLLRELEAEFDLPHDENPDIRMRFPVPQELIQELRDEYPAVPGLKRVGFFIGNIAKVAMRWPEEKFAELARVLLERNPGIEIYVVVGNADVPLLDAFKGLSDERLHTFVGNVSLKHTTAFIGTCDAFVTSSSSPQHLTAIAGVPMTSITNPCSDARWTPRGPLNFSAISNVPYDVRGVTVQQVYEALNKSMQGCLAPWKD